ncbi:MAG: helix-turn-helix domain-containing protein [Planctomycetota bacterium]
MVALPFCQFRIQAIRAPPAGYPKALRTLGDRLRARRMDLGLTQRALASTLGVNPWTLLNWELGRTAPQRRFLPLVETFLDGDREVAGI